MWLNMMMDWANSHSNSLLIIAFAIPMAWYAVKSYIKRRNEEDEIVMPNEKHHDWITNLEIQLRLYDLHTERMEKKGIDLEEIHRDSDAMTNA